MKFFNRKAVIGFTLTAGLMGLLYFHSYKPLLNWSPIIPAVYVDAVDTIYFDVNSSDVSPAGYEVIKKIADLNTGFITVIGNADSTGISLNNWKLSHERAFVVRSMFLELRVKSDSLIALGFGDRKPILPNTRIENKATNRNTIIKWRKLK